MSLSKRLLGKDLKWFWKTKWQSIEAQFRSQTSAVNTFEVSHDLEKARPFEEMPSPGKFEIIRAYMPGGKYYKKDANEVFLLMNKEYGDVVNFPSIFSQMPMVLAFNPNDFETVYRNEGIWPTRIGAHTLEYYRSTYRADFFKGVEGLIPSQDEKWAKFRSIVNPVLMHPKNKRLYLQRMSLVNHQFIERIRKIRDPKTQEVPDNFEIEINRWTLESVSVVAFDKHLGLLKDSELDPRLQTYFERLTDLLALTAKLEMKPSIWKIVSTPNFKRCMNALDNILEITRFYIDEAIERFELEKKNGLEKPENEKGVLEKLLKIDPQIAVVMAMDMLMAGVDSTTGTFAGIMLCLAKNPEKQEKLREEIRRILPNKDSEFSESSMNDMSYLRACIKESLRIYPLVISNARTVKRDVVLNGYRVPKGMQVAMIAKTAHSDEKHFPNAKEFMPERWLRTKENVGTKKCPNSLKSNYPFAFLPFGFGPRGCIGRRIAEMELELGIARIIRNFNVSYNYSTERPFKMQFINLPNIPLKFQMTELDS